MHDPQTLRSDRDAEFAACEITLDNPRESEITDAFRGMPLRGTITIACDWRDMPRNLAMLSDLGAFASRLAPDGARARLTAYKGKAGACYETGRSATYVGAAAAALDDDGHLIFGAMRVCEKTGGFYTLPPFSELIDVTPPDPALLARLDTDPVPFDCNTFERDAKILADRLCAAPPPELADSPVLYAGPFRLLVLDDGSMVWRGIPVRIPAAQRQRLAAMETCLDVPAELAADLRDADSFPARYAAEGPLCLTTSAPRDPAPATPAPSPIAPRVRDWKAIETSPAALRQRLIAMIAAKTPYFALVGSDPREANGCCPCDEVGAANRLVEAGVLSRHQPAAHPDACTTVFYAFAGEIAGADSPSPSFRIDPAVRAEIAARLREPHAP